MISLENITRNTNLTNAIDCGSSTINCGQAARSCIAFSRTNITNLINNQELNNNSIIRFNGLNQTSNNNNNLFIDVSLLSPNNIASGQTTVNTNNQLLAGYNFTGFDLIRNSKHFYFID